MDAGNSEEMQKRAHGWNRLIAADKKGVCALVVKVICASGDWEANPSRV
jgi:hypothetical protein